MRKLLARLPGAAFLLALLALACACGPAHAHLMPPGQGAVRLVGDSAYAVIALPVAALSGFDDDGDGLLSPQELARHREALTAQVSRLVSLRNGEREGELLFGDLLISHVGEDGTRGADHVVVVRRYRWNGPVDDFRIRLAIFDVPATREVRLTLRAIRGEESEATVLSRQRPGHAFFAGPWSVFGNFILTGAEHILLGADHLLFLLTVIVAGAGWRYWLAVITAFTLAHSITLTLGALEIVQVSPAVVEPLIAASIVLLAIDNLVRKAQGRRHRVALVFGCGLLHGLGIASALSEIGLSAGNRALSLAGFNLGVELGQGLFVAAALVLLAVARRMLAEPWQGRIAPACSWVAAVVGAGWMVQRLFGAG